MFRPHTGPGLTQASGHPAQHVLIPMWPGLGRGGTPDNRWPSHFHSVHGHRTQSVLRPRQAPGASFWAWVSLAFLGACLLLLGRDEGASRGRPALFPGQAGASQCPQVGQRVSGSPGCKCGSAAGARSLVTMGNLFRRERGSGCALPITHTVHTALSGHPPSRTQTLA